MAPLSQPSLINYTGFYLMVHLAACQVLDIELIRVAEALTLAGADEQGVLTVQFCLHRAGVRPSRAPRAGSK